MLCVGHLSAGVEGQYSLRGSVVCCVLVTWALVLRASIPCVLYVVCWSPECWC